VRQYEESRLDSPELTTNWNGKNYTSYAGDPFSACTERLRGKAAWRQYNFNKTTNIMVKHEDIAIVV